MVDFNRRRNMIETERRHSVHSLNAPPVAESFDGETEAPGRVRDWRTDDEYSSLHPSAGFFVGCSDYPAGEIESVSSPVIIFHDNIANLVAATDINCLSAMQYAVEVCRVENIVITGHHGCRGVQAAIENCQADVLSSWLRPVARLASKYKSLLDQIDNPPDRLDALCELNVIEQVQAACRTTVVQEAWSNGRELSASGLVYNRQNRFHEGFRVRISGNDSLMSDHAKAIAAFERRWNCRQKRE